MAEECRSCHAAIDWAYAPEADPDGKVKSHPVDHDSADKPGGKLAVWRDDSGVLRYRYLRKGDQLRRGEHTGISHFATCPNAAQHRKDRRG